MYLHTTREWKSGRVPTYFFVRKPRRKEGKTKEQQNKIEMAARFGLLCRRGAVLHQNVVFGSPLGEKMFRASSSLSSSSLLLSSPSSHLMERTTGLRPRAFPLSSSSSLLQIRLASGKEDYIHGSLTEQASEVVSRSPRSITFASVMDDLLEDEEDDDATRTDGEEGEEEKKPAPPVNPGANWREHYTGGYASVEELEKDLERYPDVLDRETYVPPSEDKTKDWESIYKERGLWSQEVSESYSVRNPLLHRGEDDLVILPCERRMEKGKKYCDELRENNRVPGVIFFSGQKRALIQMHPRFLLSAFDTLNYYSNTYWLDFGEGKRVRVKPCNPVPFNARTKKPHSVNFVALDQPPPPGEPEFYEKYPNTKQQIQAQWKKAGVVGVEKAEKRRHPKLLTKKLRSPEIKKRIDIHPLDFEGGKDNTIEWDMTSNMFVKQEEILKKYPAFEGKRCGDF